MIKNNNDIVACGCNKYGQLGLNHNDDLNQPVLMMQGISIRQIACGKYHTIILGEDGDVFVCGENSSGQLGLGHNDNKNTPIWLMNGICQIACGHEHTVILNDNHYVLVFGNNMCGQLGLGLGYSETQNKPIAYDKVCFHTLRVGDSQISQLF